MKRAKEKLLAASLYRRARWPALQTVNFAVTPLPSTMISFSVALEMALLLDLRLFLYFDHDDDDDDDLMLRSLSLL